MPMPGGRDFQQAYNCQAVADSEYQVIVAAQATNLPSDKTLAVDMIEQTVGNTGAVPKEVSADAGYYSARAVDELHALGVDPFNALEKTRHGRAIPLAPRGRIPANLSARDRMRRKLRTKRGRQRYGLRKQTVEPVFGQIKQGRGLRQFLLRSLEKVNCEWLLICTGHNLLKLFRFGGWLGAPKLAGQYRKLTSASGCSPAGRRPEDGRLCQDRMQRPARMGAITWHWLNTSYLHVPQTGC